MEYFIKTVWEKMIYDMGTEKSALAEEFRLEFGADPIAMRQGVSLAVTSQKLIDFMDRQDHMGMVSHEEAIHYAAFNFYMHDDVDRTMLLLKHVIANEYTADDYNSYHLALSDRYTSGVGSHLVYNLSRYAFFKAARGNENIRKALLELYKRSFRDEYNTLKRFSRLTFYDVVELITEYEDADQLSALARILFYSDILRIEVEKPGLYFETLRRTWNRFERDNHTFLSVEPLPAKVIAEHIDANKVKDLLIKERANIDRVSQIYDVIMSNVGFAGTLGIKDMVDPKLRFLGTMPYYLSVMENALDYELTDMEKIWGGIFSCIISNIYDYLDDTDFEIGQLLGMEKIEEEDFIEKVWKHPESNKETPRESSEKNLKLQEEIKHLKEQLRSKDAELSGAAIKIRSLEGNLIASERENDVLRKKLEKVEQSKEPAVFEDKAPEQVEDQQTNINLSLEEKEIYLQTKKCCIVGGHQNWTAKIKDIFPDWLFLKPEVVSSVGEEALNSVDKVYFFTDTLSHAAYKRYFEAAKARNIPVGYLHAINLSLTIDELYESMIEERKK